MKPNERIKEIRIKKGYSQEYLAQHSGMSRAQYASIEQGRKRLYAHELASISKALGTTADFILFGYEIDKMYGYFIRTFAQLEKEDQFDVLNYVEYRRQLRDELEAFKTITQWKGQPHLEAALVVANTNGKALFNLKINFSGKVCVSVYQQEKAASHETAFPYYYGDLRSIITLGCICHISYLYF